MVYLTTGARMIEQIGFAVATGIGGGAAAWATLQGRVARLEEVCRDLKAEKANRETVDSLRQSIDQFRVDMDKRLDRIESIMRAAISGEHTNPGA